MNKKIILLMLLIVAGLGIGYMVSNNYNGNCCKTSTENQLVVETPTEKVEYTKKTEVKTDVKTDLKGNVVEEKATKKTSSAKKTKSNKTK